MRFDDWVKDSGQTNAAVGRALGRSAMCIGQWRRRERRPGKDEVEAIYAYTDGAVTPADWYDLPALPAAGEAA